MSTRCESSNFYFQFQTSKHLRKGEAGHIYGGSSENSKDFENHVSRNPLETRKACFFLTIKLDTCELWVPPGEFWVTLLVDHIRTESQEVGRLFGVMLLFKESNSSKTL